MLLITGASGHMGRAIVDFLQKKHSALRPAVLVRSEEKGRELAEKGCEVRIGDYFDPVSMKEAMKGVDTLMFISGSNFQERVRQHANVIDAAKSEGVKQIIYTSMLRAPEAAGNPIGADHYQTEQLILGAGIPHTFFRETFYFDVLPSLYGSARETGHWAYAAGGQKVNLAARIDMAEALANIIADPEPHMNKIYEIVGPEPFSFEQMTRMLSDAAGKTIAYSGLTLKELKEHLYKAGVNDASIAGAAAVSQVISSGHLNYRDPALEVLLSRKPMNVREYLKQRVAQAREAKLRK